MARPLAVVGAANALAFDLDADVGAAHVEAGAGDVGAEAKELHVAAAKRRCALGLSARADAGGQGPAADVDDNQSGPGSIGQARKGLADADATRKDPASDQGVDDVVAPGGMHQDPIPRLHERRLRGELFGDGSDDNVGGGVVALGVDVDDDTDDGADDEGDDDGDVDSASPARSRRRRHAQRRASLMAAWRARWARLSMSATARSMPTIRARATMEWPMFSSSISRIEAISATLS